LEQEKKEKAPKDPNAPKRPLTGYFMWSAEQRAEAKANPTKDAEGKEVKLTAAVLSERWKALSAEEKKPYEDKYKAASEAVRSSCVACALTPCLPSYVCALVRGCVLCSTK
jgi:upstream-binding transcription factor